jgi:sortase A
MASTLTREVLQRERPSRLRAALRRRAVSVPQPAPDLMSPGRQDPRPVTSAVLAAGALALVGGLLIAFAAYLVVGATLRADRTQDVLYQQLRTDLGAMTVPFAGPIAAGTPLGVVSIPSIDLEQVFVEGSSAEQTSTGPGLKTDSVLPGQAGLSVLVGHRATSGAAFANLDELAPGDTIEVTTGQGRFEYRIDLVRTSDAPAAQVEVVPARLTLVTSDPAFTPDRTLVVSARLQGDALPASTGTTAPASDQAGEGSSGGIVALLLWSQLLLLTTIAVTWAAVRYPGRGLWIGATPVLLAVLWQVFENLALLLPNTL